jgi:hypothetical protein
MVKYKRQNVIMRNMTVLIQYPIKKHVNIKTNEGFTTGRFAFGNSI